jgi:hypothetical protein
LPNYTATTECGKTTTELRGTQHLVLQGVHGPQNDRLREFGIKPRKKTGPKKTPLASLVSTAPATPEVSTAPAVEEKPAK